MHDDVVLVIYMHLFEKGACCADCVATCLRWVRLGLHVGLGLDFGVGFAGYY